GRRAGHERAADGPQPHSALHASVTRKLLAVAALYLAGLLALVAVKPLWLDEVIELDVTSHANWGETLQRVAETPGGAPLGYAGQWILRRVPRLSPIWAVRLPAVLAGAASLIGFLFLCRRLMRGRQAVIIAGVLWCICPLA